MPTLKHQRIALFSMDDGDYQRFVRDECMATARRYGLPVRVFVAENDSHKQVKQIQDCLNEAPNRRPTLVVVHPVHENSLPAVARAVARAGIGLVVLQRWVDCMSSLRAEFPDLPIFSVMADQSEIGRIQGQQLKALLPQGGEVWYIRGPLGTSSATRRFAGVQEILRGSAIKLSILNSDFSHAGGEATMKEWIRIFGKRDLPRFVVVGAQNDAMAMGARTALEEAARESTRINLTRIAFCGCDGTPTYGQRMVTVGKLTSTVIMPSGADRAVAEAMSMLEGGPRPAQMIVLPPAGFPEPQRLSSMT
jgi:ABC-type sugar transport system substrate-binding protein